MIAYDDTSDDNSWKVFVTGGRIIIIIIEHNSSVTAENGNVM